MSLTFLIHIRMIRWTATAGEEIHSIDQKLNTINMKISNLDMISIAARSEWIKFVYRLKIRQQKMHSSSRNITLQCRIPSTKTQQQSAISLNKWHHSMETWTTIQSHYHWLSDILPTTVLLEKQSKIRRNTYTGWRTNSGLDHNAICPRFELYLIRCQTQYSSKIILKDYWDILHYGWE